MPNHYDRNGNGFTDASERDPGDDYDQDGVFDVFEDLNHNGRLDPGEDRDGDGKLTPRFGCDGASREDIDCDGHLDRINEDRNGDGVVWSFTNLISNEDLDHDHFFDTGTEDRNGNGVLDDAVRPAGTYPYGRPAPEEPDHDYTVGNSSGIVSGPYFKELADRRRRLALRQDLSVYLSGSRGSHDLKMGLIVEREQFNRTTKAGAITAAPDPCTGLRCQLAGPGTIRTLLP